MMRLAEPLWLWGLILLIPALAIYVWREKHRQPVIAVSSLSRFLPDTRGLRVYARHLLFVLEMLTLSLWVVAMARPQAGSNERKTDINALDIVL